ncbi:MAG: hypothetical protein HY710_07905 [Candidatus Latescibacteria bacterium]|nr:hypothetical protein [Candidatus Latescibacterota bacterium]
MTVSHIQADAQALLEALEEEIYLHYAGLKPDLNLSSIYDRYPGLTSRQAIQTLDQVLAQESAPDPRRYQYLKAFLLSSYLGQATKHFDDRIATEEAHATIQVDDQTISYRHATIAIANEPDRERQRRIHQAQLEVVERLTPLRAESVGLSHRLAVELGYQHYTDLCMKGKGLDLYGLAERARQFLAETEDRYVAHLGRAADRYLGLRLDQLEPFDIRRMLRAPSFDEAFTADRLLGVFRDALAQLGIDLDERQAIRLDVEARARKSPRAFCVPLHIPDRIMLVIMPQNGCDDYRALFHEGGHALHFSFVSPSSPFEYAYLGDNSVTESFAFLFDHLFLDPLWLEEHVPMPKQDEFVWFTHLEELFMVRRYCAKLLYELGLHSSDRLDGQDDRYARHLSEAIHVNIPPQMYLTDLDEGFYCAEYLQAWLFQAQLRHALRARYGPRWFAAPGAGAFLRDLWSSGQQYTVWELAAQLGDTGLTTEPLIQELAERLPI